MSLLYFLKDLKKIKFNYKLGSKTWFGTGGNAQFFLIINSRIQHTYKLVRDSIKLTNFYSLINQFLIERPIH